MIAGNYSRYQLNTAQFNNLFTDNVNIRTLDVLSQSAADGNLDCIDMLHNLALRHDDVGKRAENILFDLFSGKTQGKSGVVEEIQQASMKLYETACSAKEKNNEDMKKFHSPSKLLYMAGSAITNIAQKQDISAIFSEGEIAQSPFEQLGQIDLWSNARMLPTDEINAAISGLTQHVDKLSLNFPVGLIEPTTKSNVLSEIISEKMKTKTNIDKTEIFPVNTGGHWVLFVLYNDESDCNTKCAIFNSLSELHEDTKSNFIASAKRAGVSEKNIDFMHGDMQKNVPNGCGIFVIKAAEALSIIPEDKPVETLKAFTDSFARLSEEDQMLFNIQNRRQLYEYSIL
ncbi:type III secretion system effector deubiquitinase SseL [Citrobacter amalonaticus]|uniref:Deubiquitinase SseL n=1 Tax=Citrobacter amalonaticus TaxID=35703 RepID=A0A2S4RQW7_CITAM|nr:ElaD/SseL family deubiquitinase [Citrobacter amalonaticus]POT54571.1 type III secretion system effector deubiquitinase SseL [Citrobacter amalonaticus]POT69516.1 type III secretion system effector deubiquitinase SseL [Citrobacter amalonaticus]POU60327.1 type III secretion system effector deubiquitinase SseL [Citrobacter amalonaticus]POV02622.1 type III secretion system effector deubiquitinase SseL [Citrobacter amalonaticus]